MLNFKSRLIALLLTPVFTNAGTLILDEPASNVFQLNGDLYQVYSGINVFEPSLVDTNVSGEWTIILGTNAPVAEYTQTGSITNIVLFYDTNKVTFAEVLLYANGDAITWPTNNVTWKPYLPDAASNQWQSVIFRAHRGKVQAAYVESYD